MDDVIGLIMVQVISNLGSSSANISAVTIIRPLLVSLAFAVCAPLICVYMAKPLTRWLNSQRATHPRGIVNLLLSNERAPLVIHTCILIGSVAGSTYAGTSNLFAAYIAGASISWWDSQVLHLPCETLSTATPSPRTHTGNIPPAQSEISVNFATNNAESSGNVALEPRKARSSGHATFEQYYLQPLDRILKPFFFVSFIHIPPLSFDLTLKGINWFFYSHHGNVRRLNCLEGHRIHQPNDVWQACVWDMAPSFTISFLASQQIYDFHEAPKVTNVPLLGSKQHKASDLYTLMSTRRDVSNITTKPWNGRASDSSAFRSRGGKAEITLSCCHYRLCNDSAWRNRLPNLVNRREQGDILFNSS